MCSSDLIGRQWLGGIRLLDGATGLPVDSEIELSGEGLHFRRTRRGLYSVESAGLFDNYLPNLSDGVATPATVLVTVRAEDPDRRYLPRRFDLQFPRSCIGESSCVFASADNQGRFNGSTQHTRFKHLKVGGNGNVRSEFKRLRPTDPPEHSNLP